METTIFYLLMQEKYQFKAKNSEIKKKALCSAKISGDYLANNMKKQG